MARFLETYIVQSTVQVLYSTSAKGLGKPERQWNLWKDESLARPSVFGTSPLRMMRRNSEFLRKDILRKQLSRQPSRI